MAEKKAVPGLEAKPGPENKTYEKDQFLASEKYAADRDLVEALLEDGKKYTPKVVEQKIENFKKGKVK